MRGLAWNLALAALSTALILGLAEGAVRLAGGRPERGVNPLFSWTGEEGDVWRFEAGARWHTRVGGHPVVINSDGFRDAEFAPRRPGVGRIVVLGDSVTFGHGQPAAVRFTERLETLLTRGGARVEVLNAGIPGWSSYQQRAFYERHGQDLDPDLVLVGFVLNDITEVQRGLLELRLATGMRLARSLNALAERSAAVAALKRAFQHSVAPQEREVRSVLELVLREDAPEVRHAMDATLGELARLDELCRQRGDRLGLVVFPFRFQIVDPRLDAPQRRLRAFAEERGIPLLDTLPTLRAEGADATLMDADHLTALGHRRVAEAIAAWLERESLLPGVGPAA